MSTKETVTVISETLAAISIVASGTTFLYQTWSKEYQVELRAVVANSTPQVLSVLTTNSGGKDLVITSATITSKALGEHLLKKLKLKPEGELIKKGESLLLTPAPSNLSPVVKVKEKDISDPLITKTECTVHIEYVDPDSKIHTINIPFTCYAGCVVELPDKDN